MAVHACLKNHKPHKAKVIFLQTWLVYRKAKKKNLVSGNPTDPTFLGPTLNFLGTSENFSSIFRVF